MMGNEVNNYRINGTTFGICAKCVSVPMMGNEVNNELLHELDDYNGYLVSVPMMGNEVNNKPCRQPHSDRLRTCFRPHDGE